MQQTIRFTVLTILFQDIVTTLPLKYVQAWSWHASCIIWWAWHRTFPFSVVWDQKRFPKYLEWRRAVIYQNLTTRMNIVHVLLLPVMIKQRHVYSFFSTIDIYFVLRLGYNSSKKCGIEVFPQLRRLPDYFIWLPKCTILTNKNIKT